jgi:melibiose permease
MKLSAKEKTAFGLGAVGKDMVYMLSASYILYYYQDVLGVSAMAMGIILMERGCLMHLTIRLWE